MKTCYWFLKISGSSYNQIFSLFHAHFLKILYWFFPSLIQYLEVSYKVKFMKRLSTKEKQCTHFKHKINNFHLVIVQLCTNLNLKKIHAQKTITKTCPGTACRTSCWKSCWKSTNKSNRSIQPWELAHPC